MKSRTSLKYNKKISIPKIKMSQNQILTIVYIITMLSAIFLSYYSTKILISQFKYYTETTPHNINVYVHSYNESLHRSLYKLEYKYVRENGTLKVTRLIFPETQNTTKKMIEIRINKTDIYISYFTFYYRYIGNGNLTSIVIFKSSWKTIFNIKKPKKENNITLSGELMSAIASENIIIIALIFSDPNNLPDNNDSLFAQFLLYKTNYLIPSIIQEAISLSSATICLVILIKRKDFIMRKLLNLINKFYFNKQYILMFYISVYIIGISVILIIVSYKYITAICAE